MTKAADRVLIDTNVLVYASLRQSAFHAVAGKHVHDANLVAAMQAFSIPRIVTHNTGDFARFRAVITITPIVVTP